MMVLYTQDIIEYKQLLIDIKTNYQDLGSMQFIVLIIYELNGGKIHEQPFFPYYDTDQFRRR